MAVFLRTATRIGVEMVCGSVVGGLVAWYAIGQTEQAIATGALIGAALGFVVGGPAREPVRETVQG
jgi:fructose-specific phosphotransferase system IIC component